MKRYLRSPYFYIGFFLLAGMVHYWRLSSNFSEVTLNNGNPLLFMLNSSHDAQSDIAAGPLIFSFYELFSLIFHSSATAFNTGTALLAGTLTFTLLKFSSKLNFHPFALVFVGVWSVISPSIRYALSHYPHLILGMVFLLLLFLSLKHKNYFLIIVFLIHLFFTHSILALLSLILVSAMLLNRKNGPYLIPLSIAAVIVLFFHPGILYLKKLSLIFSPGLNFPALTLINQLNIQSRYFLWLAEMALMPVLFAGLLIYVIRKIRFNNIKRSEYLYILLLLLLFLPVYDFNPHTYGIQMYLAFQMLILPGVVLLPSMIEKSASSL